MYIKYKGGIFLDNYRKKMFRGAKIEDCILEFENNERQAKIRKEEVKDKCEKRFYEGLSLAYRLVSQKLRWEFDYKKEEWEEKIVNKIEKIIKQIEEFELNISSQKPSIELEKEHNIPISLQIGQYKGMALGYSSIRNKLEKELSQRRGKEKIGEIIADCIDEFEFISDYYRKEIEKAEDDFIKGFLGGNLIAYQNVLKQLKLEI